MPVRETKLAGKGGRVAVVDGLRTPFARIATHFDGLNAKALKGLKLKDMLPQRPSITEYSVGETMGESCEKMVKKWGVTRAEQDEIAHLSHTNAANAWAEGRLDRQVMTAFVGKDAKPIKEDNLVRQGSKLESYSKLKPVFDRVAGSVTAGNSSPLTDGAGALLMMSEEKAKG